MKSRENKTQTNRILSSGITFIWFLGCFPSWTYSKVPLLSTGICSYSSSTTWRAWRSYTHLLVRMVRYNMGNIKNNNSRTAASSQQAWIVQQHSSSTAYALVTSRCIMLASPIIRAGEYIDCCNRQQQKKAGGCMYVLVYLVYDTKKMRCQISCRSRLWDLRRETKCGTAYACCSPVAGGYRLQVCGAVTNRVGLDTSHCMMWDRERV